MEKKFDLFILLRISHTPLPSISNATCPLVRFQGKKGNKKYKKKEIMRNQLLLDLTRSLRMCVITKKIANSTGIRVQRQQHSPLLTKNQYDFNELILDMRPSQL